MSINAIAGVGVPLPAASATEAVIERYTQFLTAEWDGSGLDEWQYVRVEYDFQRLPGVALSGHHAPMGIQPLLLSARL